MLKEMRKKAVCSADIVFLPALTPMEAAVLPARERETYGVLRMIGRAYDAGEHGAQARCQRAKIWVR